MKKIKQLLVAVGNDTHIVKATDEKPITLIRKNGEMAFVDWYERGNEEYNGKFVISVNYYE